MGLLDGFFPNQGGGGLLGIPALDGFNQRLNQGMMNPATQMGLALMMARPGRGDEAMSSAMQNIAMQQAFGAQRADRKAADERDRRDHALRVQTDQRMADQWSKQFGHSQAEAARAQANADRAAGLQERTLALKDVPDGFRRSPEGNLSPIPGGPADPAYLRTRTTKQDAPSGYVWIDPNDPNKGVKAIPGGPGEKVDSEVAARLGMAKSFLGQLPDIRKRIDAGEATGPIDAAAGWAGYGNAGEIKRQIASGAEALLRNLTGAGMSQSEAASYVERYQWSPRDTADRLHSKLNQLERELMSVSEVVGKGRGGDILNVQPNAAIQPGGKLDQQGGVPLIDDPAKAAKLPSGTTFRTPDGRVMRVP